MSPKTLFFFLIIFLLGIIAGITLFYHYPSFFKKMMAGIYIVFPEEEEEIPIPPQKPLGILIEEGAKETKSPKVKLTLIGGEGVKKMAISNFEDFRDALIEEYKKEKEWDLCKGREICSEGQYTVYVKFYTKDNKVSRVSSDDIFLKIVKKELIDKEKSDKKIEDCPFYISYFVKIKYGTKNEEIRKLQEFLKEDKEVYPEGLVTGYFGPLTLKALKRFQLKYKEDILWPQGILDQPTGLADPLTRKKINELKCQLLKCP